MFYSIQLEIYKILYNKINEYVKRYDDKSATEVYMQNEELQLKLLSSLTFVKRNMSGFKLDSEISINGESPIKNEEVNRKNNTEEPPSYNTNYNSNYNEMVSSINKNISIAKTTNSLNQNMNTFNSKDSISDNMKKLNLAANDINSLNKLTAPPPPPPTKKRTYVQALFDYKSDVNGDLSFSKGDQIMIIKKSNDVNDWWVGKLGTSEGSFPANYVTELN